MYDSDEGEAHADALAAPHQEQVHIQEMWSSDEEAYVPPAAAAAAGAVDAGPMLQCILPAVDSDDALDANTERWMANDPQCGLCDDGGELLLCEGRCMRSFHAKCLRMEAAEYDALTASPNPWHCPACVTGMHACFRCGQVGSLSAAVEAQRVHKCGVFECTRFYHLACAGPGAAPGFECPLHRCCVCQRPGSQAQGDVIPCRRCPVGYHVGCIPLAMIQSVEPFRRVWLSNKHLPEGAPPSRVDGSLVYCLKHDGAAWPAGSGAPPEVHFQESVLHSCAQALVLQTCAPHRCLGCRAKLRPAAAARESCGARGKAWGDAVEAAFKAVVAARTAAPSLADLRDGLGGPANYKRRRCQHTIGEQQLQLLETTVADAQRLKASGRPAEALAKLDGTVRRILDTSFAQLRVAFAPFNFSCRYTSYGRHFTRPSVLQDVSNRLALFLRHGDTAVDSSCGANDWLPSVRKAAADVGIFSLKFRAFDIFTPANKDPGPVVVQDWFEISHADLGYASGDSLVIGLNPPFGVQNALAEQFITKAVEFRARLIVLIVPPSTRMPLGYAELVRDIKLCAGHAFYLPGSHDPKQGGHAHDWCKVAPAFIVLQRADTLGVGRGPRELIDPGGLAWGER